MKFKSDKQRKAVMSQYNSNGNIPNPIRPSKLDSREQYQSKNLKIQKEEVPNQYSKKYKAMERLIYLQRVGKANEKETNPILKERISNEVREGFQSVAKELDKEGVSFKKQNYLAQQARETNDYMSDIINRVYKK